MQKMFQSDKKFCPSCSISQEPYIIWFSFMVHMCKMIISSGILFIFSKFWFFWVVRGVKSQKTVQNDSKFCLSHFICQEPYIMIVIHGAHVQNDNISRRFFHFFKIFIFGVVRGLKEQKMVQNGKFCQSRFISQEPYIIWLSFMVHMCKMIVSPGVVFFFFFFHFFKILIFWTGRK